MNPVISWLKREVPTAAIWGFTAFFVGASVLGETWPVSRFPMYAQSQVRTEGAMPTFTVDGEIVEATDFEGFAGAPFADLLPNDRCRSCELITGDKCKEFASSQGYITQRDLDWMRTHVASGSGGEGRPAVYGYRSIRVVDGAVEIGPLEPTWCGTVSP